MSKESVWEALFGGDDFDDVYDSQSKTVKLAVVQPPPFMLSGKPSSTETAATNTTESSGEDFKRADTPLPIEEDAGNPTRMQDDDNDDLEELLKMEEESIVVERKPLSLVSGKGFTNTNPSLSHSSSSTLTKNPLKVTVKSSNQEFETDTIKLAVRKSPVKQDDDFDLCEMESLSFHDTPGSKLSLKNTATPSTTSIQDMKTLKTKKLVLSNLEKSDLEDFLNDDSPQTNTPNVSKTAFGTFLSPNAESIIAKPKDRLNVTAPPRRSIAKSHGSARSLRSIDIPEKNNLDFSNGQDLPVKNWNMIIMHNSQILEYISFAQNRISELPDELKQAKKLKHLDISFNKIERIPSQFKFKQLQVFNGNVNRFSEINSDFINLFNALEELRFFKNEITRVDATFSSLNNLSILDLSCNYLKKFPSCLLECYALTYLDLSGNQIEECHDNLSSMKKLQKLNLSDNKLVKLSTNLLGSHLEELDLSHNLISITPPKFKALNPTIKRLYLNNNELSDIPANFSSISTLTILDIRNNPIKTISPSLGKLQHLKHLMFDVTEPIVQIKFPPEKICMGGFNAMMSFFQDVLKGATDPDASFAFGSGLSKTAIVCEKEHFLIKAVDKYGLQKTRGGDVFHVTIEREFDDGTETIQVIPKDNNDGAYYVEYNATIAGKYTISVLCDGQHIKDSPFVIIFESGTVVPQKCTWENTLNRDPMAGEYFSALIHVRDSFGNALKTSGHHVSLHVHPENSSSAATFKFSYLKYKIEQQPSGVYACNMVQTRSGITWIKAFVNGEEITTYPIEYRVVPGVVNPLTCSVSATGTRVAVVNQQTSFIIQSKDQYGNHRVGFIDEFKCFLHGSKGDFFEADISPNVELGEYCVTYTTPYKGRYKVEVYVKVGESQMNIGGSPFELQASEARSRNISIDNRDTQKLQQENIQLGKSLAEAYKKITALEEKFSLSIQPS